MAGGKFLRDLLESVGRKADIEAPPPRPGEAAPIFEPPERAGVPAEGLIAPPPTRPSTPPLEPAPPPVPARMDYMEIGRASCRERV